MQLIAYGNSPLPVRRLLLKSFLVIKLTFLLLLVMCVTTSAKNYAQKVSLSVRNAPMGKLFKEIRKQTGYTFIYTELMLQKAKPVSIHLTDAFIEQVLDVCFQNQPLTYTILNQMVIVKERDLITAVVARKELPPVIVTGKITSGSGEPLGGATIAEKGTQNSALTKEDGSFRIEVSQNTATLVVSYVGFETKEIQLNNQTTLNISLVQTSNDLNDVVVVGYGTQKRKDLTGSVTSVGSKDIQDLPIARIDQALVGKVAGVQVKTTTGEPGAPPQIRVRGIGSISAGASPLYVVDGFPTGSIETLNPNDIESLDILKDASATAIYGSRGSNGVIIINT
ncbi:MAG TPA: TonB-dependent receptor plug domain-containing protein, partial [Chitinophagaceae bacterium]|nr:TonB-dependent receptor plug domain-containing protein [Chitinophagaceae bacterium]